MTGFGFKTYHVGLLQAKAYRVLRSYMADSLKKYQLTAMEWTLLGYIAENSKDGTNISDLAEWFGVEMSLITNSINKLSDKGLVSRTASKKDKRIRIAKITKKGATQVETIEASISAGVDTWLEDITPKAMLNYLEVLKCLADKR